MWNSQQGLVGAAIATLLLAVCSGPSTLASAVVVDAGSPAVTLSTKKLAFGVVTAGTNSAPKNVTLRNTGTATLNISNIAVTDFFVVSTSTCGGTVAVGKTCKVSVIFTPPFFTCVVCRGTLSFTDDAADSPQMVALIGYGSQIAMSPESLNFGTVTLGNTSQSQTVTLTNVATPVAVSIYTIGFGGPAAADYLITNNTCARRMLQPGESCTIDVAFMPSVLGTRQAKLSVKHSGTGQTPQTVRLTGVGG